MKAGELKPGMCLYRTNCDKPHCRILKVEPVNDTVKVSMENLEEGAKELSMVLPFGLEMLTVPRLLEKTHK